MFETKEILFRWNAGCAERCMPGVEPGKSWRLLQRLTYGYPSLSQAQRLKKFSADGKCTLEAMCAIMSEEKKGELDKVTLTSDKLRKYFPKSYTPQKMEETILKLLETWHKKRTQQQER